MDWLQELQAILRKHLDRSETTAFDVGLDFMDSHNGHAQLTITIESNDRALTLGQYPPFTIGGPTGYHENYIFGLIRGYADAKGWVQLEGVRLVLEVVPVLNDPRNSLAQIMSTKEAVSRGLVDQDSDYVTQSIPYLLVSGCTVSGPSLCMYRRVQDVVEILRPRIVADLFSGTGALADVAERMGCEVRSYDITAWRPTVRVLDILNHTDIVDADADLIIADPYYVSTLTFIERIPSLLRTGQTLVLNLGDVRSTSWGEYVTERLRESVDQVLSLWDYNDERVAHCIC